MKNGKRLFSILLALTMVVGLFPGMSLTAYAAGVSINAFGGQSVTISSDQTCTSFDVFDGGTLTVNQGVTLTLNISNGYVFNFLDHSTMQLHGTLAGSVGSGATWMDNTYINVYLSDGAKYTVTGLTCMDGDNYLRYYGYDAATDGNGTVSVTSGSTAVTASSIGYKTTTYTFTATPASGYKFKNWTKGAGGEVLGTDASINVTCEQNGTYQVYANFEQDAPAHTHSFTYTADGDTITATCSAEGCDLTDNKVTLKIVPNSVLYYDDGQPKEASLEGLEAFNAATGKNITTDNISYYKDDTNVTAQIKAGSGTSLKGATYTARLDVEGVRAEATFKLTAKPVPHTHSFTYTANGNVITATCNGTAGTCDLTNKQATLTLNAPAHKTYGDGLEASATLTGEIPGVTNPTIYYSKGSVTLGSAPTDAGTYTAWCQLGNATARVEYTIDKAANTGWTTLPHAITDLVYTGQAQALITAGAASVGETRYGLGTADSDEDAYYTGAVPSAVNAGTYYVWCKIDGGKNYTSINAQKIEVSIAKADITPSVSLVGWTYGETANTPMVGDAANPGNGEVTYTYKVKGADDSTYTTTVPTNAGDYTVKAVIAETANYNGGEATADFTIAKADITPVVSITGWTYGEAAETPSVTGNTGNGDVTYTYAVKDSTDFSETVPTNAGDYTVKAVIAETANYNGGEATADFTVAKAEITITADDKSSKYGEDIAELTYQISGAYKTGDDLGVTVNTTATKTSDVGEYEITVDWNNNSNYTATLTNGKYTITKTALNASASGYSGTYDGEAHGITVDVGAADATVYYAETELTADNYTTAGSTTAITRTDAGTTTVYYYVASKNYDAVSGSKTVEITKADPTATAPTGLTAVYGDTLADVTLPDGWAWAAPATNVGNAGTNTFKATFTPADTANYNTLENIDVTVTVAKADITPTVSIEGWAANEDAKTPSVTGNPGNGAVTYTYAVKGSTDFSAAVPTAAGDYTVKATVAETANYNGGEATADFTIKAVYTVKFNTDGGTEIKDQTVVTGEKAAKPADPEKDGHEFSGWYQDAALSAPFDFDTPITADVTLYAKWTAIDYSITNVTGVTGASEHVWTKGSSDDVVITVKVSEPDHSFDHFVGVEIDGKALVRDTDYTVKEGSTIVTLKAATVQKLSVGVHTVTILFDNGKVDTKLTVKAAAGTGTAKSDSPKTGDESSVGLWIAVMTLCGFGIASTVLYGRKKKTYNR